MKYDYIVAIDPDTEKSGVATLRTSDKKIEIASKSFPNLMGYFRFLKSILESNKVVVVIEAGWMNSSNWHLGRYDSKSVAAAKGNSVGRNHETARKIAEMARVYYGLEVVEIRPLKKCWSGKDGKITQEEISQFIPDFPKRSNQEERDAMLIAWNYAGFPIRIKPIKSTFLK